ncbi:hypothetical protein DPMN_163691 [Dreissena polymorpha]|uniref:Sulfotransferase n=1 Tax=Dreissena polymorpha TaxID=45954 RepID=A0A9D4IVE3_DREPO|nr:hypothetical protein DPMN_163691 [Dreissena polymorpha]
MLSETKFIVCTFPLGRVGNWKEHLSEAAGNTIDAMVEDKLGDLDIQFDYGH